MRDPDKADVCRSPGADHVTDVQAEPLADRVRALTDGKGADIIDDTVGTPLTDQALDSIAVDSQRIKTGAIGTSRH